MYECRSGCREQLRFDYLETHLCLRCQFRPVNCRLNCGSKIKFYLRVQHETEHCSKREIVCWQCNDKVISENITTHLHEECPSRLLKCSIGCGQMFKASDLHYHENEICQKYCKWECGQKIGPPDRLNLHELTQCLLRTALCKYNCRPNLRMTAGYVKEHMESYCPMTPLICPNSCDCGMILRKDLRAHMDSQFGDCMERFVRCPSNYVGWRVLIGTTEQNRKSGIVVNYKRFYSAEHKQDAECASNGNIINEETALKKLQYCIPVGSILPSSRSIRWKGTDKLCIRFDDCHEWIDPWTSPLVAVEKVSGAQIGKKYSLNDKFDCGFIPACELNVHLETECKYRSVWVGAKVPLTAAQAEAELAVDGAALSDGIIIIIYYCDMLV